MKRMRQPMSTRDHDHARFPMEDPVVGPDEQVAELLLLLPGRQAAELERRAHSRGLTLGQLIRLLIRDYLTDRCGAALISTLQGTGSVAVHPDACFDLEEPIRRRGIL
jgi:hypothetical protein